MLLNSYNFLCFVVAVTVAKGRWYWQLFIIYGGYQLLINCLLNHFFLKLDKYLYPKYKNIVVKKPIFIFGNARSGTTLLERLLFERCDTLTYQQSYEMSFPAISQRKILRVIGRLDSLLLRERGSRLLEWGNQWILGDIAKVHPTSLFVSDEDEAMFNNTFYSPTYPLGSVPSNKLDQQIVRFNDLPAARQEQLMNHYHACIQRHLYFYGEHKRYCSKHVVLLKKITTIGLLEGGFIKKTYPDATIIYLVRDPLDVVPSAMNLMRTIWIRFGYYDHTAMQPLYQGILDEICDSCEQAAVFHENQWHGVNVITVGYNTLVNDPVNTLNKLNKKLGIDFSEAQHQALKQSCEQAERYTPATYCLEEFGFDKKAVMDRTKKFRQGFKDYI